MSAILTHEADTPISNGSPASVSADPSDSLRLQPSLTGDCDSPEENCSERSESPVPTKAVTPQSEYTPTTNGLLTPPNDSDGVETKSESPTGRLKFYKDGVLCLELSHHGEGEKTRWVQIKSKTFLPSIVHSTKEVVIPRHYNSTSDSPVSSFNYSSRIESSASHSASDDASSMLSSPRIRDSSFKKCVPQKNIAASLQFYFNAATCARKIRQQCKIKSYRRQPYCSLMTLLNFTNGEYVCSCKVNQNSLTPLSKNLVLKCSKNATNDQHSSSVTSYKSKKSLVSIIDSLSLIQQQKLLKSVSMPSTNEKSKFKSLVPKKRPIKDHGLKDQSNRSKRHISSVSNHKISKTILNIPGFKNDSRSNEQDFVSNSSAYHKLKTIKSAEEISGTKKHRNSVLPDGVKSGAKSNAISVETASNSAENISRQQQKLMLERQTVSKAISYTVNSLLSNSDKTSKSSRSPSNKDIYLNGEINLKEYPGSPCHPSQFSNSYFPTSISNANASDQNSFLRHLLDTSDPIPKVKPKSHTAYKSESHSKNNKSKVMDKQDNANLLQSNHVRNSTKSPNVSSSLSPGTARNPKSSKPTMPLMEGSIYAASPLGLYPPPSYNYPFLSGAFALPGLSPYESLLNANLLANFNPHMASVMASYMGNATLPNTNLNSVSTPPRTSTNNLQQSRSNPTIQEESSSPINLSRNSADKSSVSNGLSGMNSFHSRKRDNLHSSENSDRDFIADELPLNLSKKS